MTAWGDDLTQEPRVQEIDHFSYSVEGREDQYDVTASTDNVGTWLTCPGLGSATMRRANLRDRDEAQAWVEANTVRHDSLQRALAYALARVGAA